MKKHLLTTGALLLMATASLWADRAHDIANDLSRAEKGSYTQGEDYAQNLYQTFTKNGIEAYLISFNWKHWDEYGERSPHQYRASFVVFKDSEGRYWGRQSTSVQSKWLSGTTPQEWTDSFCNGFGPLVTQVAEVSDNRVIVAASTPQRILAGP